MVRESAFVAGQSTVAAGRSGARANIKPLMAKRFSQKTGVATASLLFDWLEELVYLKDAHGVVFHDATLTLDRASDSAACRLHGWVYGEPVDPARQELRSDVKGVTKHLYEVKQADGGWKARVVLDV